jgi:hypothetical protein
MLIVNGRHVTGKSRVIVFPYPADGPDDFEQDNIFPAFVGTVEHDVKLVFIGSGLNKLLKGGLLVCHG